MRWFCSLHRSWACVGFRVRFGSLRAHFPAQPWPSVLATSRDGISGGGGKPGLCSGSGCRQENIQLKFVRIGQTESGLPVCAPGKNNLSSNHPQFLVLSSVRKECRAAYGRAGSNFHLGITSTFRKPCLCAFSQRETQKFPFQRGFPHLSSLHNSPCLKLAQGKGNLSVDLSKNGSIDCVGLDQALGNFITNVGLGGGARCLCTHVSLCV